MHGYRYNFLDDKGGLQATLILNSRSDDEACELGSELLLKSECSTLEISRAGAMLYRIGRDESKERRTA